MEIHHLPEFKDISWRVIAYIASFVVIAAIVFAFTFEIELKQDVPGEIISQSELKIQGLRGLVSKVFVNSKDRVQVGSPLFRLDRDFTLTTAGLTRSSFDENLRNEQQRTTEEEFRQRSAELKVRLATQEATLKNRQEENATQGRLIEENSRLVQEARSRLNRLETVADYVVADRVEQAKAELRQARIAHEQSLARRQQLQAEITTVLGSQTELQAQLKSLEAAHERGLQDINARFERERINLDISSPSEGVVTFLNLQPGRTIAESDVALVIATGADDTLRAGLRVPSRRRGFIREGQIVRLKFDAFPYTRFGTHEAKITEISRTIVAQSEGGPDPNAKQGGGEGDYIAWAELAGNSFKAEGKEYEILPGMRLTGSVVIERRTIAEWVFAPIFAVFRG